MLTDVQDRPDTLASAGICGGKISRAPLKWRAFDVDEFWRDGVFGTPLLNQA